jgi:parallel beta-helix repeat protein
MPRCEVRAEWNGAAIVIEEDGDINVERFGLGIFDPGAPLIREGDTYYLVDDVKIPSIISSWMFYRECISGIIVKRSNITIDGNGHILKGIKGGIGINIECQGPVKIKNMRIANFSRGIAYWCGYGIIGAQVIDVTFENNTVGLYTGAYNTIIDSKFVNCGMLVEGYPYNIVIKGCTVNGKPLIYVEGTSNVAIRNVDAGQVILARCSNIIVEGLEIYNTTAGIQLFKTSNSSIVNNKLGNNLFGIYLFDSLGNRIAGNGLESNNEDGIYMYGSENNTIIVNELKNNDRGIDLSYSDNNVISENLLENNSIGIFLDESSNNRIYLNSFINNTEQVSIKRYGIDKVVNFWDYNSKGNYWSNYNGTDDNGDGIGDIPHMIDDENEDSYPLMKPYLARFEVSGLSIRPDSAKVGEMVTILVTVKNTGSRVGSYDVMLKINDKVIDTKTVTLDARQLTTVSFSYKPESDGIYDIDINGQRGRLEVIKEEIPLFSILGVSAAIVVMIAAVAFLKRRPAPTPEMLWIEERIKKVKEFLEKLEEED